MIPCHRLNDGYDLPAIGFGTYPLRGAAGVDAIVSALQTGYRLIDSAVNYENEGAVGEAIRRSGVPREEITITSNFPDATTAMPMRRPVPRSRPIDSAWSRSTCT